MVAPVTNYIMEVLPEGSRDTKPMELAYEDLEKLSGEEVMRICEWLTDKVLPTTIGSPRRSCKETTAFAACIVVHPGV